MDKYLELKYIQRLGLPKLKQVQAGYNCSCIKCKEGRMPWKTRLYFLTNKKPYITVYCQLCGYSTNFRTFLQEFYPNIFEEYLIEEKQERLKDLKEGTYFKKEKSISELNSVIDLQYQFELNKKYFKPAKNYRKAVEFCKERNILEHIDSLYYNIHPKHLLTGMVIFPFVMEDQKTLYAFQGRHTDQKLFHTHSKNESMKVYNIYNVNLEEEVFIFESIIDSLMVNNSIAMLGTSLSEAVKAKMKKRVWIFDNDNAGRDKCLQYLEQGEKCLIFPNTFKWKDFNEAVCKGNFKKENFPRFIKENTCDKLKGVSMLKLQMIGRKK